MTVVAFPENDMTADLFSGIMTVSARLPSEISDERYSSEDRVFSTSASVAFLEAAISLRSIVSGFLYSPSSNIWPDDEV